MQYQRPQPAARLNKRERQALLEAYYQECSQLAEKELDALNRKLPRETFATTLDTIGALLLREAATLVSGPGPVREFLDSNPLPASLQGRLPDEFRAFCLLLNAVKQWVASEQAATDRYLLGGEARKECRAAASCCAVSGVGFKGATVELHHPVRDGRPPIPLTKAAHASLEGQLQPQEEGAELGDARDQGGT
jgi:hypothetical protein